MVRLAILFIGLSRLSFAAETPSDTGETADVYEEGNKPVPSPTKEQHPPPDQHATIPTSPSTPVTPQPFAVLPQPMPEAAAIKAAIHEAVKSGDVVGAREKLDQAIHDFPRDPEIRAAADKLAQMNFHDKVLPGVDRVLTQSANLFGRQWVPGGRGPDGRDSMISIDTSLVMRGTKAFKGETSILESAYGNIDRGDPVRAEADLSRAIRRHGDAAPLYYARAMAREMSGDYRKADQDSMQAVTLSHGEPVVLTQRAGLMVSMGRRPEALAWAQKALEVNPVDANALAIEGHVLWDDRIRHNQSLAIFEKAARIDPEHYGSTFREAMVADRESRAVANMNSGDLKQAKADAQFVLATEPRSANAHLVMSYASWKEGNSEASIKESTLALKNDPSLGWAYLQRAMAMESLGARGRAIADMRRAAELNPSRFKATYDKIVQAQRDGSPPIWTRPIAPTVVAGAQ